MFGLTEADISTIQHTLRLYPSVKLGIIFGSRAKGNYRNGSDVDLAIKGNNVPFDTILAIAGYLNEESIMPYHFDVLHYDTIENKALTEHIDRIGIVIYEK